MQLLIASLTAESLLGTESDGLVRRQQFVFASSVLLTTSVATSTIRTHPSLLRQLWSYVESPGPLDTVRLQYFCRCAGALLLGGDADGPTPPAAGMGELLRHLLRHLHSDAVAVLLKCLLNLHPGTLATGRGSPVPLRTALAEARRTKPLLDLSPASSPATLLLPRPRNLALAFGHHCQVLPPATSLLLKAFPAGVPGFVNSLMGVVLTCVASIWIVPLGLLGTATAPLRIFRSKTAKSTY